MAMAGPEPYEGQHLSKRGGIDGENKETVRAQDPLWVGWF